jgi:hypothetical protein
LSPSDACASIDQLRVDFTAGRNAVLSLARVAILEPA